MKTEDAERFFINELKKHIPEPELLEIFKIIVRDVNANQGKHLSAEKKNVLSKIDGLNIKLSKARELLLTEGIEPSDYKIIKSQIEEEINKEELKLSEVAVSVKNIERVLLNAGNALEKLDKLYLYGNIEQKREIIGSIFPEKMVFDKDGVRTAIVNEAAGLMSLINNKLREKKKGRKVEFSLISQEVNRIGFEPMTRSLEG